jgi:hypothetical protein
MTAQCALSRHRAHLSVLRLGTNRREGLWQDKSRKVLGGRRGEEMNNCKLLAQGARALAALLYMASHWECRVLHTLPATGS